MGKKQQPKRCPNCGSRNIQTEGKNRKGRQTFVCEECDEVFDIFMDQENDRGGKGQKSLHHS